MSVSVLFVDDDAPMLRALKREFSYEYDLSVAYSAAEAQTLISGHRRFDVVISDVTMPGMNELEFIDRAAPQNPHTSFIVLTDNCDAETHARASSMPAVVRVLTKPASRELILEAIGEAVSRKSLCP